jgi:hypothetical protein
MIPQDWVPESTLRRLTPERREAVQDVFDSLGGSSPAAGTVRFIVDGWVGEDPALVESAVAAVRSRLYEANLQARLATEQAKAVAALLRADGCTEVETGKRLGVSRMSIRRWFGKGTR